MISVKNSKDVNLVKQKRVAAIHDISGFGKCSLTVALPIISSAGIETCAIPTAILSTHTGGIDGFTYHDLSDDLIPIAEHWHSLNLHFDAIYSGFLGSFEQIDMVNKIFDILKNDDTLILVDPCMADNGKLYKTYTKEMAKKIKSNCSRADILVPNLTEACILLDIDYKPLEFDERKIYEIAKELSKLGAKKVVITGISFHTSKLGAIYYDSVSGQKGYYGKDKIRGAYHGTGDIFASVLLASLLNNIDLTRSVKIAVNFTVNCIERTYQAKTDERFGVNFESELLPFAKLINKEKK